MHFFIQSRKQSNQSSRQKLHVQTDQGQRQKKVIKKIVVRKKPKQKLDDLKDEIIQAESVFNLPESTKSRYQPNQKLQELKYLRMSPFGSFMAQGSDEEQLKTPFLMGGSGPNYRFQNLGKNVVGSEQQHQIQQEQQHQQDNEKHLTRVKSRSAQFISHETVVSPINKRKNSMQTDFQDFNHESNRMRKYPTQLSSESQDNYSNFRHQGEKDYILQLNKKITSKKLQNTTQLRPSQNNKQLIASYRSEENLNRNYGIHSSRNNNRNINNSMRQQTQESIENTTFEDITSMGNRSMDNSSKSKRHSIKPLNLGLISSNSYEQQEKQVRKQKKKNLSILQQLSPRHQMEQQFKQSQKSIIIEQKVQQPISRYNDIIQKQAKQLELQKQRYLVLSQEANRVIFKQDVLGMDEHKNGHIQKANVDIWASFKYILQELIQLFCIGEVIKYQLKYRSYQILTKIYAEASKYFQEQIQLEQPIKVNTFTLAIKAILNDYQKSQIDLIINKIFNFHHQLTYQQFFNQFQSILNSKQVQLFEPSYMKKQVDKTLQKVKKLFVIWVEIQYYTKKIKQILRTNKSIYDSILIQCSYHEDPDRFDIELIQKFLLQTSKKSLVRKLKIDIFFRNLLGNELLKKKWTDWIHIDEIKLNGRRNNSTKVINYQKKEYVSKLLDKNFAYQPTRSANQYHNKSYNLQNTPTFGNKFNSIHDSPASFNRNFNKKNKIEHKHIPQQNDSKYLIGAAALHYLKSYMAEKEQPQKSIDYKLIDYNHYIKKNSDPRINELSKRMSLPFNYNNNLAEQQYLRKLKKQQEQEEEFIKRQQLLQNSNNKKNRNSLLGGNINMSSNNKILNQSNKNSGMFVSFRQ